MLDLFHKDIDLGRRLGFLTTLFGALLAFTLPSSTSSHGADASGWTYPPSLVIDPGSMELSYIDGENNEKNVLYTESYAILIMQGDYKSPWSSAKPGALTAEHLLVNSLKARHFHVDVWRDLDSKRFSTVIAEAMTNYSYKDNARIFFYYYGHGVTIGGPDDPGGPQFFLVPVDAPSSADESAFVKKSFSGATLMSYVHSLRVKHAFFAFEACRSGGILSTLADPPAPNPQGYLRNPRLQDWVRQFLTAGNEMDDIPADAGFTALLAGGLSSRRADTNDDGFISGTELMAFVSTNIANYRQYPQSPEIGVEPRFTNGDFVFGQVDPTEAASLAADDAEGPTYGGLTRLPVTFDKLDLLDLSNRDRYLGLGFVTAHTEFGDYDCSAFAADGDVVLTSDSCAKEELIDYTPFEPDYKPLYREVRPSIKLLNEARQSITDANGSPTGLSVVPLVTRLTPSNSLRLASSPHFPAQAVFVYADDLRFYAKIPDCNLKYSDKPGGISSDCTAPDRTEGSPMISAEGKVIAVSIGPQRALASNDKQVLLAIEKVRTALAPK